METDNYVRTNFFERKSNLKYLKKYCESNDLNLSQVYRHMSDKFVEYNLELEKKVQNEFCEEYGYEQVTN